MPVKNNTLLLWKCILAAAEKRARVVQYITCTPASAEVVSSILIKVGFVFSFFRIKSAELACIAIKKRKA